MAEQKLDLKHVMSHVDLVTAWTFLPALPSSSCGPLAYRQHVWDLVSWHTCQGVMLVGTVRIRDGR